MGILSLASSSSLWKGYDYFESKNVFLWTKINEDEYEAQVKGSGGWIYNVKINISHPRKSKCDCPHANGTRIICKHMVALFFTAFPKEAENYIREVEEYEREEEEREQERYDEIIEYVESLTEEELKIALVNALLELEKRNNEW